MKHASPDKNELQAPLPYIYYGVSSPSGLDLNNNVLVPAQNSYIHYIKPPTNMVASANQTPAPGASVTFSVTAGNVQPGPTLSLLAGNIATGQHLLTVNQNSVPEDGTGNSPPYLLNYPFPMSARGIYSLKLSNPGSSYSFTTYDLG